MTSRLMEGPMFDLSEPAVSDYDPGRGDAEGRGETCSICQCEFTVGGDAGGGLHCLGSHFHVPRVLCPTHPKSLNVRSATCGSV